MFGGQDNSSHTGIKSEFEHESERDYSRSYDHDHDQDHSNVMKDESTMDYDDDDDDHDERPSSADQSKEPKFDMDTEAMSSDTSMFEQRKCIYPLIQSAHLVFFKKIVSLPTSYLIRSVAEGTAGS